MLSLLPETLILRASSIQRVTVTTTTCTMQGQWLTVLPCDLVLTAVVEILSLRLDCIPTMEQWA